MSDKLRSDIKRELMNLHYKKRIGLKTFHQINDMVQELSKQDTEILDWMQAQEDIVISSNDHSCVLIQRDTGREFLADDIRGSAKQAMKE